MLGKLGKLFCGGNEETATTQAAAESTQVSGEQLLSQWSTVELDGHQVDVFEPSNATPPSSSVLFLHGHGRVMLKDNVAFSTLFQKHNLAVVCPDGKRSWWMDQVCSEFSTEISSQQWLIEQMVPFIEQRWQIVTPKVALLGVSMGGQGALQLSFRDAASFPVVAAIAPAVDFHQMYGAGLPLDEMYESLEDARQMTVVLNLHPLAWPRCQWFCCDPNDTEWFDGAVRLGMKLSSSGILYERDLDTEAGGHTWEYFNHMAQPAVEHIVQGLARY